MLEGRFIHSAGFAAFLMTLASTSTFAAGPDATASPDVEQLLAQLRSTLLRVQETISDRKLPELKSVQINLQTAMKITGGGKVIFFVVSLGDTVSQERTQSIKITLIPPKITSKPVGAPLDFSRDFANSIIAVADTIAQSAAQKPELQLSALSATIKFVSESKFEGGVAKVQLLPISLDLGGSITPTNTQEAVLTFESSNN